MNKKINTALASRIAYYTIASVFILSGLSSCSIIKFDDKTFLIYARAKELYANGRFPETIAALSRKNIGIKAEFFVPVLILRGKAEYFSGRFGNAEKTFRRALLLHPSQIEASLYLANILRETGNDDAAKKITEALLADDPSNIRALRLAAGLNSGDQNAGSAGGNSAMIFLDRAAAVSEETAMVFLDRARLLWINGEYTAALSDLRRAKALIPSGGGLLKAVENLENIITRRN
jgi:tetratricopeptide (TPR) repeat protein